MVEYGSNGVYVYWYKYMGCRIPNCCPANPRRLQFQIVLSSPSLISHPPPPAALLTLHVNPPAARVRPRLAPPARHVLRKAALALGGLLRLAPGTPRTPRPPRTALTRAGPRLVPPRPLRCVIFAPAPAPRRAHTARRAGECKQFMQAYLECLRKNASSSTPCRHLNKDYLECRMSRCVASLKLRPIRFSSDSLTCEPSGLMERDDWKNLGLSGVGDSHLAAKDNPKESSKV